MALKLGCVCDISTLFIPEKLSQQKPQIGCEEVYTLCCTATAGGPPSRRIGKKGIVCSKIKLPDFYFDHISSGSAGCQEPARNKLKECHVVLSQALRSVWLSSLNLIVLCAWILNSFLLPPADNSFTFRKWFVTHECGLYFLLTMSLSLLKPLLPYAHGSFKVLPGFVTLQYILVGSLALHTITVLCYLQYSYQLISCQCLKQKIKSLPKVPCCLNRIHWH